MATGGARVRASRRRRALGRAVHQRAL